MNKRQAEKKDSHQGIAKINAFIPTLDPDAEKARVALAFAYYLAFETQTSLARGDTAEANQYLETLTSLLLRHVKESGILGRLESSVLNDCASPKTS